MKNIAMVGNKQWFDKYVQDNIIPKFITKIFPILTTEVNGVERKYIRIEKEQQLMGMEFDSVEVDQSDPSLDKDLIEKAKARIKRGTDEEE